MEKILATLMLAFGIASLPAQPGDAKPARPQLPSSATTPTPRPPDAAPDERGPGNAGPAGSAAVPVPTARPPATPPQKDADRPIPSPGANDDESARENATIEASCLQRLGKLGVSYKVEPPIAAESGCALPVPLTVSTLGPGIELDPPGTMNCELAEATARFAQTAISSQALRIYGSPVTAIANASTYVCRPRNGTTKLSEHAFGNALDIARFVLADGTGIDVTATGDPRARDFLKAVRNKACGPFKTVLGPGSDADHATHFHLDLAHRKNGSTFCQ